MQQVRLREADLARAWEDNSFLPRSLVDDSGHAWRVIFPGRRWGGPGPDFQGAVLLNDRGEVVRGDVEIHVSSQGWRAHGHTTQAGYQQVVLHVVGWYTGPTYDGRGRQIPTVVIQPGVRAFHRTRSPCQRSAGTSRQEVEEAGWTWFLGRVAALSGDLSLTSPSQVAWHALAEALGYSQNKRPMGLLADLVPWDQAQDWLRRGGVSALAAVLLGTAGLAARMTESEQETWDNVVAEEGARPLLQARSWERSAIRPGNAPELRCRGLAALAARWADQGLAEMFWRTVEAAQGGRGQVREVTSLARAEPWVGAGRARTIAVNVVVPFSLALGLAEAAAVFARLPGEPWNRATRYMAQLLGLDVRQTGLAVQRQGLLWLYKQACAAHWCEGCPASRRTGAGGA